MREMGCTSATILAKHGVMLGSHKPITLDALSSIRSTPTACGWPPLENCIPTTLEVVSTTPRMAAILGTVS